MADPEISEIKESIKDLGKIFAETMQDFAKNAKAASGSIAINKKINDDYAKSLSLASRTERERNIVFKQAAQDFRKNQQRILEEQNSGYISAVAASDQLKELSTKFKELFADTDLEKAAEAETKSRQTSINLQMDYADTLKRLSVAGKLLVDGFGVIKTASNDLVSAYQSNASDIITSGNLLKTELNLIGGTAKAAGGYFSSLGKGLEDVSIGNSTLAKGGRLAGKGLDLLGKGLNLTASATSILNPIIDVLTKELDMAYNSFQKINSTGAIFVDGLSGMKTAANGSGLLLEEFSEVIKNSSEQLAESGLGMTQAARQMAAVGKTMRETGLQQSLRNLGYEYKDQAELVADTMSIFAASGKLRGTSDQQLAQFTGEYATNLKLLSSLTGEDAKKVQEKNRKAAFEADVFAQIAKAGPEAVAKFQAQIELFNKADPSGKTTEAFKQQIAAITGVADPATVAFMDITGSTGAANQALKDLMDPTVSLKDSTLSAVGAIEDMRKGAIANVDQLATLTAASRVSGDGLIKNVADMSTNILSATGITREAALSQASVIEEGKKPQDELTSTMMGAANASRDFKIAMQEGLLEPKILGRFAEETKTATENMTGLINKIKEELGIGKKTTGTSNNVGLSGGGALTGAMAGASFGGSIAGPYGALAGGLIGAAYGSGLLGNLTDYSNYDPIQENVPGYVPGAFAEGGISRGPTSGYLAQLHGTEAVLPPDLTEMLVDAAKNNQATKETSPTLNVRPDRSEELLTMLNGKFDDMIGLLDDISNHTERTSVRVA